VGPAATSSKASASAFSPTTVPLVDSSPELQKIEQPKDKVVFALQKLKDRLDHSPIVSLEATLDGEDVWGDYVMFEALNIP